MSRRRKISDATNAGTPATLTEYRHGEHWKDRHDRRKRSAKENKHLLLEWCAANGFAMQVRNEGHHFIFTNGKTSIEWWPSSAKLVIDKRWREGIHTHDVRQVLSILGEIKERDLRRQK